MIAFRANFAVDKQTAMMEAVKTNYPNLDSESFGHGKKRYFIDVKKACNDTHFLLITSSEQFGGDKFHRQTVQLWEEDLAFFVEALSMILRRMTGGESPRLFSKPELALVKGATGLMAVGENAGPREKLHAFGPGKLRNAELLAVLLGTGSVALPVLELCRELMRSVKDDPAALVRLTAADFCSYPGIGMAKAAALLAAIELGRRIFSEPQACY